MGGNLGLCQSTFEAANICEQESDQDLTKGLVTESGPAESLIPMQAS